MTLLHLLLSVALTAVPAPAPTPARPAEPRAAAVLHAWDHDRAEAWARADPSALRTLYAPGSAAGRADVAMLRAWRARGLRVTGLRMQVLALRVRQASARRLVLLVTDRVASAYAVGDGVSLALPPDPPTTRRLVLVRRAGDAEWRLRTAITR